MTKPKKKVDTVYILTKKGYIVGVFATEDLAYEEQKRLATEQATKYSAQSNVTDFNLVIKEFTNAFESYTTLIMPIVGLG
jgi:hypothetical protein